MRLAHLVSVGTLIIGSLVAISCSGSSDGADSADAGPDTLCEGFGPPTCGEFGGADALPDGGCPVGYCGSLGTYNDAPESCPAAQGGSGPCCAGPGPNNNYCRAPDASADAADDADGADAPPDVAPDAFADAAEDVASDAPAD